MYIIDIYVYMYIYIYMYAYMYVRYKYVICIHIHIIRVPWPVPWETPLRPWRNTWPKNILFNPVGVKVDVINESRRLFCSGSHVSDVCE